MASKVLLVFILMGTLLFSSGQARASDWKTVYEKSGYQRTSRYAGTIRYCQKLDSASAWVKYRSFGKSPQGRDLPLVIVDKDGDFAPEAAARHHKSIVLIQSGIHAGEIDGKDASLILIRQMAITRELSGLLEHATVLFIPIFNVDGHEQFGPFNRINQNGPEEMGWRVTAQNLNLNRDFLKAETPEMQAWLRLFNRWLPDLLVDCHVTDGADYQYVLTYGLEQDAGVAAPLRRWSHDVLEPEIDSRMNAAGYLVRPYFWLKNRHHIKAGIIETAFSPRYSNGYGAAQNRVFLLVETHMLKPYRIRVEATRKLLTILLNLVNRRGKELQKVNRESDRHTETNFVGSTYPLRFYTDLKTGKNIQFRGIEYHNERSDVSGGDWVRYGKRKETFELPLFNRILVRDSVQVPAAYLIPPQWQMQIATLHRQGVRLFTLQKDTMLQINSYYFSDKKWQQRPFEGHHFVSYKLKKVTEKRFYPRGTVVVPLNQRAARVAVHLLEPKGPDSFVRWGMWDVIFEQKEYAEDYVLEKLARKMLAENPALAQEYRQKVASDSAFAANPPARLFFFYRQSPYWDNHINRYPVGRLMQNANLPLKPFAVEAENRH